MFQIKEMRTRLTWLVVGLMGSLLIARLIHSFETVLEQQIILASFIPLVVYMSDAVGTQMEAIVTRELNKKFDFSSFFSKQVLIVVPIGIVISVVAAGVLYVWKQSIELSTVVGLSLLGGIICSLITGALIPYIFWKLHEDPAEASGPVATVIQDFLSVFVFFSVAQMFF